MPGHLHSPVPDRKGHLGERAFIERLVELGDTHTHVWGDVDYLPSGVPDIDAILVHEDLACFNIEVKAVPLDAVEEFGLKVCQIRGRNGGHHPVLQAGRAVTGLVAYVGTTANVRAPFFFATAAFPLIKRSEFAARFSAAPVRLQAEGMIFADDLVSSDALLGRLQTIRVSPPHKGSPRRDIAPTPVQVKALLEVLDPGSRPAPTRADRDRGEVLRVRVGAPGKTASSSGPAAKYLTPSNRKPVVFRGAPGTGKTVQLQEIAVAHARAGRPVLFTCYNKVLASTLRGIMSTQRLGDDVNKRVVVTHVDELVNQLNGDDREAFRGLFETICVDEAQDMPQEHFDFLRVLAADDAEWFLADGPGQELYGPANKTGEAPPFVQQARAEGSVETLRRNYRNKTANFLFAQAVYEHAPNTDEIAGWVAKHPLRSGPNPDAMLDLGGIESNAGGELPRIVRIALPTGPRTNWQQAKLHSYVAIFHEELEKLAAEGKRRDLAILCAMSDSKKWSPAEWCTTDLSERVPPT
ncbi:nuclease-related domain-containing DEAD/DEAH box helicase [Pimelobacter simplex]|uniref:nuclease-related domain-containing DEAD/DEAH box helicase n=1 Tax=Nocardioides simplex TaxID=2045 RepID=UPI00214FE3A5|nr:nuclease-related domain-containing DEAD/DEAH box helicase [Pimelobacter simplex]UUW92897.1 AAA family ATPase [Pimelobacter simplex]UUW98930.1 AAA family ATPase [Pimelobacter simplex]